METRSDLAIVIPCAAAQSGAVYRVLASLSLQADRRFVVYAFFEEGDAEMRALLEDYSDGGLDLLLRPVPALPGAEMSKKERCTFFARQLRDETFVSFSDGVTLYGPECIGAFHKVAAGRRHYVRQYNWNYVSAPQPHLTTCWWHSLRMKLGWEELPLSARVFRMEEMEGVLAEDESIAG